MGCFSFLCKKSGKPALSTSFDGSPVHLFLLKDRKCIEYMYGNYDSYGRVFKNGHNDSFSWHMPWNSACDGDDENAVDVCDLMHHVDESNGIAVILDEYWDGEIPTTRSVSDPNQGWGSGEEDDYDLMGDCSTDMFPKVDNPIHLVATENTKITSDGKSVFLI